MSILKLRFFIIWLKSRVGRIKFYTIRFVSSPTSAHNYIRFLRSKSKIKVRHLPLVVICYITDRCNLDCQFCLRNRNELASIQHEKMQDMSLDTFKSILDVFMPALYIRFGGQGEPLLNKDIFKMLELTKKAKKEAMLLTNGLLLNKENIRLITKSQPYIIEIGLYGIDEEEFMLRTKAIGGVFCNLKDNISLLVEAKRRLRLQTNIYINYLCSKTNIKNMRRAVDFASSLSVDGIIFKSLAPPECYSGKGLEELFFEDDKEVIDEFKSLKRHPRNIRIFLPFVLRKNFMSRRCQSLYKQIAVDAEGNITSCCSELQPNSKFGNIFEDNDIYNTDFLLEMRKSILDKSKELPLRCQLCCSAVRFH